MDRLNIKNYAISVIQESIDNSEKEVELFKKLYDNGLIDNERVLKGCINHLYDKAFKENDCSVKNSVLDTAIEFDVSTRLVENTIYKFRHIRLSFD